MPEDAAKYPEGVMLPNSEWTVERMRKAKYALAGTVDQVTAEFEALKRMAARASSNGSPGSSTRGRCRWEEEMRQMELFAEHIIPAFRRAGAVRHTRVKIEAHSPRSLGTYVPVSIRWAIH